MSIPNEIVVSVKNWVTFKGRGDVVHNSWFRCSNRLLDDPDFFEFTHEEILVWIYILSLCSIKNSGTVTINLNHADRVCRLKKQAVLSAIKKLQGNQLLPVDVTPTVRERYADDTSTCATDRQTDITDITNKVASTVQKPSKQIIKFSGSGFLLKTILNETKELWSESYTSDYIEDQIKSAEIWLSNNPLKQNKTVHGWGRFMSAWLLRGWDKYTQKIPSVAPKLNGGDNVGKVLEAAKKFGRYSGDDAREFLGPELWMIAIQRCGGWSRVCEMSPEQIGFKLKGI